MNGPPDHNIREAAAALRSSRPIDLVLAVCGTFTQTPEGALAHCPVHGDANPSLLISEAEDGRVLIVCRSQRCDPKAIVESWGLKMANLFPTEIQAKQQLAPGEPQHSEKPIAVYEYLDRDGVLLFQVLRYQGAPRFRQRRPSHKEPPASLWIWDVEGLPKIPYRLPEVNAAVTFGQRIYIVEGEKDADALASIGLTATTNAGGAGNWSPECTAALTSAKTVTIIPDNDAAGQKHARAVRDALLNKVGKLRILNLPNLPPKGDVSDWLSTEGTRDKLEALANAGPTARGWTSAVAMAEEGATEVDWIAKPLLSRPSLAMASGDADTYKSWNLTQLCLAAPAGHKWMGKWELNATRTMLVTADEDRAETRRKIAWLLNSSEPTAEQLQRIRDGMLVWTDDLSLDDTTTQDALLEDVEDHAPDIIVLDHIRVCWDGNEDSSEFARKIKLFGRRLHRAHPCCVLWIHHVRKAAKEKEMNVARQRVRGTGGLVQSFDHHLAFERTPMGVGIVTVDRNKKGGHEPQFCFEARFVDSEGLATIEYRGDAKFAAGVSENPGRVLETLRDDPRKWRIGEIQAALPDLARRTIFRALKLLEMDRLVLAEGANKDTTYQARETADWAPPGQLGHDQAKTRNILGERDL